MRNGKNTFKIIWIISVQGFLLSLNGLAQTPDSKDSVLVANPYRSFSDCASKSGRTTKPSVIKMTKRNLTEVKTIKNLLKNISDTCDVFCAVINLKMQDDKEFEFLNIGNDIVYLELLNTCKFILVESVVTSCPLTHKANYKIILE